MSIGIRTKPQLGGELSATTRGRTDHRLRAMSHDRPVKPREFLAMLERIRTPRREELLRQYERAE